MNPELNPCPFCGATRDDTGPCGDTPSIGLHNYPGGFRVECEMCGASGPWYMDDHRRAIEAWNKATCKS